jgi:tRNA(Ile)-lysidine synthase
VAVHINHGLQVAATSFEQHCVALCEQLGVPLIVQQVNAKHARGQSPEDAARLARYEAFDALAPVNGASSAMQSIAIAQHADDQVETLLLALSRGSGLSGLSAMPQQWQRHGLSYYRPFLAVRASDIRHWLAQRAFGFIVDPSNSDERFTRNRIRARIMPALQAAFPHFLDTFSRSAAHAAQAQTLLDELAEQDRQTVCRVEDGLPMLQPLRSLSRARQANLLRFWLKGSYRTIPSAAQLSELLDQIEARATRGHAIHIKVGQGFVQLRGLALHWYNP